MANLKIKDYTGSSKAISALDGEVIYSKIIEAFERKEPVVLDFSEIDLTITAFLNASIGKLYSHYNSEEVKNLLDIQNLNQDEVLLLKFVIEKAKERFNNPQLNQIDEQEIQQ